MIGRVELGPGHGVVVAAEDVALLVLADRAPDRLLTAVRDAAAAGGAAGSRLARDLAAVLVGGGDEDVPPFGALADTGDGLLVLLYGPVTARVTAADGPLHLSGSEATTWVDRVLRSDVHEVTMSAEAEPPPAESAEGFVLTDGVVPGGWLRLVRDPDRVPEQTPTPPAMEEEPGARAAAEPAAELSDAEAGAAFVSIPLAPDRGTLRSPLPVEEPQPEPEPAESEGTAEGGAELVEGILCARQHFNSPDARYCHACGIAMVHRTHHLVRRPRPPLGFLVLDDGSTFTLDDHYVLGREPETDPLVQRGQARRIALTDEEMSVSRVHAEIRLVGWEVQLVDRGSTNGTHLLDEAGDHRERLTPDEPRVLPGGTRGALGQRRFAYESPHHG